MKNEKPSRSRKNQSIRSRSALAKSLRIESLETRAVMANNFLAGTAFVDSNSNGQLDVSENYLPGATIELRSSTGSLLQTTTTDSKGGYLFSGLAPGNYKLVNLATLGFVGTSSQAQSRISPVTANTANTIDVSLTDPADLRASIDTVAFFNSPLFRAINYTIFGTSIVASGGQLPTKLHSSSFTPNPTASFLSLCVDLYNDLSYGVNGPFVVTPDAIPIGNGSPKNAERVAYLFNHYGQTPQGSDGAAAVQIAVWELLYDANSSDPDGDLLSGNFKIDAILPSSASAAVLAQANALLAESVGKSESAVFLNVPPPTPAVPGTVTDRQGVIVSGSFNFGNQPVQLASLGNFVWEDLNANGVQDSGEPGIANAVVSLVGPSGPQTFTTGPNGLYQFSNLIPGTYTVSVVTPAGFTATLTGQGTLATDSNGSPTSTTLAPGGSDQTLDFGFFKPASLGNFVWEDLNANGVQDSGEPGIAGAVVSLAGPSGPQTFTTGANGLYQFSNLIPGTYTVSVVTPAGFNATLTGQGTPATDSNGSPTSTTLASGDSDQTLDFGYYKLASLGDYVWHDENADGLQADIEPPIAGATVRLLKDGVLTGATTTTDTNGIYAFNGLIPGSYAVQFDYPTGFTTPSPSDTGANAGIFDTVDSDGLGTTLVTAPVTLVSGQNNKTLDQGFYKLVSLGDFVWEDLNANGIQDSGEPGIAGAVLTLAGPSGPQTFTTGANGLYQFTGLIPGEYTVTVTSIPAGFIATQTGQGTLATDSNGSPTSTTLLSGETDQTLDFGYYKLASLGDFVWEDQNANGIQDSGEPGIAGAVVSLAGPSGPQTFTTGANGLYQFTGLIPGTYTVTVTSIPAGFVATQTGQGTPATDSNGSPTSTTLASGGTDQTLDFGYYKLASLGDFVWEDLNANGVQDSGEPGIAGAVLTLAGPSGPQTFTTGANGLYQFTDLIPGTYTVTVTSIPAGFIATQTGQGTLATDSNGSPTSTTLASGGTDQTLDFGYYKLASLGDFVWEDLNANGIQDSGEPGIAGAVLTLAGPSGPQTFTTGANGLYQFTDLIPGTYTVTVTSVPAGFVATQTGQGTLATDSNGSPTSTTLASGGTDQTLDFGYYKLASLGDFVWEDLNANGVQDSGEPGIAGAVLTLAGPSGPQTFTTGANGLYQFTDLIPGSYTVTVTSIPAGFVATQTGQGTLATDSNGSPTSTTLASGGTDQTLDFGYYKLASLGDFVWEDLNANGVQDSGEPGIAGAVLTLAGPSGPQTFTTGANGLYQFTDLIPGTYTVTVTSIPAGFVATQTGQGTLATDSNGSPTSTTLASGGTDQTLDFGYYKLASLGDFVWEDLNANGVQDSGEPGIAGAVLTLAGPSGPQTFTTGANGLYQFTDLIPGSYTVTVTSIPAGFVATQTGQGTLATDSNGSPTSTTLASGGTDQTLDFGYYKLASLGDFVWEDLNANGVQDSGEPGIAGAVLTLAGPSGPQTFTTGANGLYQFTDLIPGTYTVTVTSIPAGFVATQTGQGTLATDSNGSPTSTTLASGGTDQTLDFGYYKLASLGDFVWEDLNANGVQDSGEPGIAGAVLTLAGPSGPQTFTTGANGLYQFTDLIPGTYTVTVTSIPAGFVATQTGQGTLATDSNGSPTSTTLASGGTDQTLDFGYYKLASLGDFVWEDLNANGVQDSGEPGIAGAVVSLAGPSGPQTFTTGANGLYQFTGLIPGTYTVTVTSIPAGFVATLTGEGTLATDSNGSPTSTTLASGGTDQTLDFGYYKLASLGNFVWEDLNANGIQDSGEPGIAGAVVSLAGPSGPLAFTTGANGLYQFTDLIPGTYTVSVVTPSGFIATLTGEGTLATDSNGSPTSTTLASGGTDQTLDFGYYKLASLGNFVWEDLNANGIQDSGEPGIAGAVVSLAGPSGPQVFTTGANGLYQFTDLIPGTYTVTVTSIPAGFVATQTGQGTLATDSNGSPTSTTLASGGTDQTLDFGYYKLASLGDFVWNDQDANGIQDPTEVGIPGAVVKLRNSAGTEIATTTTNASGLYQFVGLVPGTYSVAFVQPLGFTAISPANQGGNDAVDSDGVGALLITAAVTLASGEFNSTLDQGFYTPNVSTVCIDIDLQGNSSTSGTLGNSLNFSLSNGVSVNASAFSRDRVTAQWAAAYLGSYGGGLGVTDSSEGNGANDTHTVDNLGGRDNYILFKFNQDVVIDSATLGYVVGDSDVTIWIGTVSNAFSNPLTLSDGLLSGFYSEENLTTLTTARLADLNAGGVSGNILIIAAAVSDDSPEDRFKVASLRVCPIGSPASIGNFVWNDFDADGIQDAGEPGIPGAVVRLRDSAGATIATTTTNSNGLYSFTGLTPGSYSVQFSQPSGFTGVSPANVGANDAIDSDGVGASLITATVTLAAGENNTTLDQGFFKTQVCVSFVTEGNSATDGTDGNVLTFTSGSVSVKASALSRDRVNGVWAAGFLGSYGGGLGVTDTSEGDGAGDKHTVDNLDGRDNYVVYRFSESVVLDAAYLGYVVGDSDLTVWIGTVPNAFNSGITVTDALLSGFTKESNTTTLTGARLADLNASGIAGNVIIIAADVDDTSPEDRFKIERLDVCTPGVAQPASIGNFVWHDMNANGIQDSGEPGIPGATVVLTGGGADGTINGVGDTTATTTTDANGLYSFTNLSPGVQYRVNFALPATYTSVTPSNVGTNDSVDSDGLTPGIVVLGSGQNNDTIDIGFYRDVRVGNYVWNDVDFDGVQDAIEVGIGGVVLTLTGTNGSGAAVSLTTTTAADGSYNFNSLPPGTYQVTVASSNFNTGGALAGFTASPTLVGTNRAVDSNTNPSATTPGTLVSGNVDVTVDFGYYLSTTGVCVNLYLEGNSATDGTDGNVITFSSGSISAKASAFSRDKSTNAWSNAYLGRYAGGLGVTDSSEGTGSGNTHTVDNIGRNNYVLFVFNQVVTVDSLFLGYVAGDSDLRVWIGNAPNAFTNGVTMSDAFLSGLGFTEVNLGAGTTRTADINAGGVSGNILVVAAHTSEANDQFKIAEVELCAQVPTTAAGTKFYVVDDDINRTFKYGSVGNYQSNFGVAPTDPRGIASNAAGSNVWIADYNGRIFNYTSAGAHVVNWQSRMLDAWGNPVPVTGVQGVTTNGTHIWTVSEITDRVYYYANAAGTTSTAARTATSSFALNQYNTNPTDLTTDGTFIWVVNEGNIAGGVGDMVFKYTVSGSYLGRWQLDAANSRPTGITVDPAGGNKIWIVDNEDDRIYEYSGATGCVSGGLIASHSYALHSSNTNAQGIADPPVSDDVELLTAESSTSVNEQYLNPAVNPRNNSFAATDVNDDGLTTPLDALTLISRLKKSGTDSGPWIYDDVNNDGVVSPVDVLLVISRLNASGKATTPVIFEQDPVADSDVPATEELTTTTEDLTATEEAFNELGAEGEASVLDGFFADFDSQIDLLAGDLTRSKKVFEATDHVAVALAEELEAGRRRLGRLR